MNPNETSTRPELPAVDRREFLRLSGTLAAAGALASQRHLVGDQSV